MPIVYKKSILVNKNIRHVNRPKRAEPVVDTTAVKGGSTQPKSLTKPYKIVSYAYMASSTTTGAAPNMYYVWTEKQLTSPPGSSTHTYIPNATCFPQQLTRNSGLYVYDGKFNRQWLYPVYEFPLYPYENQYCQLNTSMDNVYLPKNLTVLNIGAEYGTKYCKPTY